MFGVAHVLCIWCAPSEQKSKSLALVSAVLSSHAGACPQGRGIPEWTYRLLHLWGCHQLLHHTQPVPALFFHLESVVIFPFPLPLSPVLSSPTFRLPKALRHRYCSGLLPSTAETFVHLPSPASRSSLWQLVFKLPPVQGCHWDLPTARPPCPGPQ